MKVLGFSAGAAGRESNVDRMVRAILDRSGHDTEFVKLTDLRFSGCRGCVARCAAPKVCTLDDDLLPHYQTLKEADAVVIGSPVYFGSPNATTLAFLERFFGYRHVEIAIKDKPFVLALAGCGFLDTAKDAFVARLSPFEVNVLDVVQFRSAVFPCYTCGYHKVCTVGGLYYAMGEAAHTVKITPDLFHTWEVDPDTVAAIDAAADKLRGL
jgi:hypothetical protein